MKVKYRPLGDMVLLQPDTEAPYNEYKGLKSIVVPDMYQHGPEDRNVWGTVVAMGPACKMGEVKLGDHVLVGKFSGEYLKLSSLRKYLLVREYDILCKEVAKGDEWRLNESPHS